MAIPTEQERALPPSGQLLGTTSRQTSEIGAESCAGSSRLSVIDKEDEFVPLRDEVLEQIKLQQPLFLAIITVGGIFLSFALQPTVPGLIAMLLPILGLGIAMKLSAHDLRSGQIGYYLRFVLKAPWEIVRRLLFSGSTISEEERAVLFEQGIDIPTADQDKKHELAPLLPDMHAQANRIVFLSMYVTGLGIGVIRTYRDALHLDVLTLFIWTASLLATCATMVVLGRRRVR